MTLMSRPNLGRTIAEDFLRSSWPCIETLVKGLATSKEEKDRKVRFFRFKNGQRGDVIFDANHFFLRASVEYSNPQLTVEEVQGIIAARLFEVCGNYFHQNGLHEVTLKDIDDICAVLENPPRGLIVSFLLNTDDIEADRYSMNPLKESIVTSGQSSYPCASVKTERLQIDEKFVRKYEGSLFCRSEVERVAGHLKKCSNSYMDTVDAVKYEHLESLSQLFGIDLCIPSLRMPLAILENEKTDGPLHYIIREAHRDYQSIERVYRCMGRSIKNLTTLLTVPHSSKGYASKRAARGRIYFDGAKLKNVKVGYKTTPLYPNAIDPNDVSVAHGDDSFIVEADKLINYSYKETPSSPQFFLYSLASPEDAVLWHGIGAFGASELLKSYTTTRLECHSGSLLKDLKEKYGVTVKTPLQFNLIPKHMWFHPVHRNIDASIGCIGDLSFLASLGMKMEHLPTEQFIRK